MNPGITITVTAVSIPDLAAQLAELSWKFAGVAKVMAAPINAEAALAGEVPALLDAIDQSRAAQARGVPAAGSRLQALDAPTAVPAKTEPAKKAAKAPKPAKDAAPKDRFFEEEAPADQVAGAPTPPATPAVAPTDAASNTPAEPKAYHADMSTEDCFVMLRAKAKLVVDTDGMDELKKIWLENWAAICPEAVNEAPGLKRIEADRDAIVRALTVFDAHHGFDAVTGEPSEGAASDPAADLL